MTYNSRSRNTDSIPSAFNNSPTLADVYDGIYKVGGITNRLRSDLRSAVKKTGKVIGRPLAEISARPKSLRMRIDKINYRAVGLTSARWNNIRSLLRKALELTGVAVMPGRHQKQMSPTWSRRMHKLPTRTPKIGLSRFGHHCSDMGVEPDEVTQGTFEEFHEALELEGLLSDPRTTHREACRCWDIASKQIESWPKVGIEVPNYRDTYSLDWSDFDPGYEKDVDEMLAEAQHDDPFAKSNLPKINARSAKDRRMRLLRFASAAVHNGIPADRIKGISDLVEPDVAKAAIRFSQARSGKQKSIDIHHSVKLLCTLARRWVGVDEDQLNELTRLKRVLAPEHRGMTRKNRDTLRHFDDPALVPDFLKLPGNIYGRYPNTKGLKQSQAVKLQVAIAIALLSVAPVRIKNLASIHIDRNLIHAGGSVHLFFSAEKVKNDKELEFPLPDRTVVLLERYMREVRPYLIRAENDWLFPGEKTGHKMSSLLSVQIATLCERSLGVRLTAHQFRYLMGYLYLKRNPGAYEIIRLLLGHRTIQTTIDFYTGMEAADAVRHFDREILTLMDDTHSNVSRTQRGRP